MQTSALTDRKPSQFNDDGFAELVLAIATSGSDSAAVQQLTAETLQRHAPFRLDRIYCNKTGRVLGTRDTARIAAVIDTFGEIQAIELLPYLLQTSVDFAWLRTDGDALDLHEKNDPVGYFVYSASRACAIHYADYNRIKREWKSVEARMRYLMDMIKLFELVDAMPREEVIQRNGMWRVYHSMVLPQYAPLPVTRLCDYAHPGIWAAMQGEFRTAFLAFAKKHNQDFSGNNFRHLYNELLAREALTKSKPGESGARGNSSFRKQKRYKPTTIVTELGLLGEVEREATSAIDSLFAEYGVVGNFDAFSKENRSAQPAATSYSVQAGASVQFSDATLEAATAPEPVAKESFASLARKLSSAVPQATNTPLIFGKKG